MNVLKEGQIIKGEYKVIEKIGEGATAKVYLAYDLANEIKVALKVLKDDNITERKIKSFQREARAISMLNHENIIKIYKIDQTPEFHYIVQEYVEGITLKDYIEKSYKVGTTEAKNIILQVLKGLEHAHENKIVHKDIKGQNILINTDNKIKITDFGIADILEDEMTKTQSLMGTPQYVAPEVLNKGESTVQTDIYSTGILLYELLIGSAPFKGEKPTIIIMKQLNQPLPSVKKQREEIPQSMENVLIRATAKKLENRYATAQEMIIDLDSCLDISRANEEPLIIDGDFEYQELTTTNLGVIKDINEREKKNKKRALLISMGLIGLVLLVLINFFIFFSKEQMTMADLSDKTQQEAINVLLNQGLSKDNITIEKETNDKVQEGNVISTEPSSGQEINKNTNVVLTISSGKEPILLQNYVGKNIKEAQSSLEEQGIIVTLFYEESDEDAGTILEQNKQPGEKLPVGSKVQFIVSKEDKEITLNNFLGINEDEVQKWVDDNNLNISKEYSCNDNYDEGKVFYQNPAYNSKLKEGDMVTVKISNGACPPQVDNSGSNNG